MPSFRKILKAKSAPHRERSQPTERKQLGFLQKKKDYKVHAKKNEENKKAIKVLHQKALDRNPDEFCYNMITQSKLRKNAIEDDDDKFYDEYCDQKNINPISIQERKLLTRDANYVNWKLQIEKKKIQKLKNQLKLSLSCAKPKNHHIYFIDGQKPTLSLKNNVALKTESSEIDLLQSDIDARKQRVNELRIVLDKLNVQKDLQSSTKAKNVLIRKDDQNHAAVYKWKPMRKK